MGGPVAWTMGRIPRAICSVTEGAGKAGMRRDMATGNIGENGAVRPAGSQGAGAGDSVARSASIAGTGLGVASPAIGRRAVGDGIDPDCAAVCVTDAGDATGKGRCPGRR